MARVTRVLPLLEPRYRASRDRRPSCHRRDPPTWGFFATKSFYHLRQEVGRLFERQGPLAARNRLTKRCRFRHNRAKFRPWTRNRKPQCAPSGLPSERVERYSSKSTRGTLKACRWMAQIVLPGGPNRSSIYRKSINSFIPIYRIIALNYIRRVNRLFPLKRVKWFAGAITLCNIKNCEREFPRGGGEGVQKFPNENSARIISSRICEKVLYCAKRVDEIAQAINRIGERIF